jgi:tellurium resistance protein TerD
MVDLTRVPADVQKITFTVTIHEADARKQNFGQVQNAFIRLVNAETNVESPVTISPRMPRPKPR